MQRCIWIQCTAVCHLKSEHFFCQYVNSVCIFVAAVSTCRMSTCTLAVCSVNLQFVHSVQFVCSVWWHHASVGSVCSLFSVVPQMWFAVCLQCGTSGSSVFAVWHRASVGGLGSRDLSSPVTIIDSWQITSNNPPWSSSPATCWCWRWPSGWSTCCNNNIAIITFQTFTSSWHLPSFWGSLISVAVSLYNLYIQGGFLTDPPPPKSSKYKKVNLG